MNVVRKAGSRAARVGRPWTAAVLSLAMAVTLGLAPRASAMTPTTHDVDDSDIRGAVESEYLVDSRIPFNTVDVGVKQGIVTLSGKVGTIVACKRAVELARGIKGVRAVVDEIQLAPAPRTDAALRQDVERALLMDPAADSYELKVAVAEGVVTLTGQVDSWPQKQIAERVTEGVRGVKEVRNQVTFETPTKRPDSELAAEIRKRLSWDARVDDGLLDVAVDGGKVRLTGTVGSALEKAHARGLAWVPGVTEVASDGLQVQWWARKDMRREKYVFHTDEQLKQAVRDAFLYDPRVFTFNPDVEVNQGVVSLSGVVENLEARQAAEADARNTVGVVLVRNHLKVRPVPQVDDRAITRHVQAALARDPFVDRYEVGVLTLHGEVSLAGAVGSSFERQRAETIAAGVKGVVDVHNRLEVEGRSPLRSDMEVEKDIQDELLWSPFVDSDEVHVTVQNGVATLTGTVDTWADRSWAAENARDGGARGVRNQIKVRNANGAFWSPF